MGQSCVGTLCDDTDNDDNISSIDATADVTADVTATVLELESSRTKGAFDELSSVADSTVGNDTYTS